MRELTVTSTPSVPMYGHPATISIRGLSRLSDIVKIQSDAFKNPNQWYTATALKDGEGIFENIPIREASDKASTAHHRINIIQLWPKWGGEQGEDRGHVDFTVQNDHGVSVDDDNNDERQQLKKIIGMEEKLIATMKEYIDEIYENLIENSSTWSLEVRRQGTRLMSIYSATMESLAVTKKDYAIQLKAPESDPDAPPLAHGKYLILNAAMPRINIRRIATVPLRRKPVVTLDSNAAGTRGNNDFWEIEQIEDGWYTISQRKSSFEGEGVALGIVSNAPNSKGDVEAEIFFAEKNLQSPIFHWQLEKKVDGSYVIRSRLDGRVLQSTGRHDGDVVKISTPNKSNDRSQRWLFEEIA